MVGRIKSSDKVQSQFRVVTRFRGCITNYISKPLAQCYYIICKTPGRFENFGVRLCLVQIHLLGKSVAICGASGAIRRDVPRGSPSAEIKVADGIPRVTAYIVMVWQLYLEEGGSERDEWRHGEARVMLPHFKNRYLHQTRAHTEIFRNGLLEFCR